MLIRKEVMLNADQTERMTAAEEALLDRWWDFELEMNIKPNISHLSSLVEE